MAWCFEPFAIYKKGHPGVLNEATGQVERPMVACGRCRACIATKKNDWTGRLSAEAGDAKAVYFLTLTYKHEPEDENGKPFFRYKDIQRMFYLLRAHLTRHHGGAKVRFFCVGERGERKGRIHWHLLLFFDRNFLLKTPEKKKLWEYWPHGWTKIERVPPHDTLRRVRYCAKYAVKTVGDTELCRPRFSTVPMIGAAFAVRWAQDVAAAGLDLRGTYRLPGHIWQKGHRKGEHIRYRLRGAAARRAAQAYLEGWTHDRPWNTTDFLRTYAPQELTERIVRWPHLRRPFEWNHSKVELEDNRKRWLRLRNNPVAREEIAERVATSRIPDECYTVQISPRLQMLMPQWQARLYHTEEITYGKSSEEIAAEIAAIEESNAEKRAAAILWEPERRAAEARHFRRSQCERHGVAGDGVEEYIATGDCPVEGANAARIAAIADSEGISWDPERWRWVAIPFAKEREVLEKRLAAESSACRSDRTCAVEYIDPETGEVGYRPGEWSKTAERPAIPKREESRGRAETLYRPNPRGLGARAIPTDRQGIENLRGKAQ